MDKKITYMIEIILDKKKIELDGEYDIQELYNTVELYFSHYGIKKIKSVDTDNGKCVFYGCTDEKYGEFGYAYITLFKKKWFQPYLLKYKYYSKSDQAKGKWYTEDVLDILKSHK